MREHARPILDAALAAVDPHVAVTRSLSLGGDALLVAGSEPVVLGAVDRVLLVAAGKAAGRMAQGWQEHEWRFRLPGHTTLPLDRLLPSLGPGADLAGRSVLVTHEEGVGDTLMFLRYVPVLAQLGDIAASNPARSTSRSAGGALFAPDQIQRMIDRKMAAQPMMPASTATTAV